MNLYYALIPYALGTYALASWILMAGALIAGRGARFWAQGAIFVIAGALLVAGPAHAEELEQREAETGIKRSAVTEGAQIFDIRLGVNETGRTRIVLDMSDTALYRVYTQGTGTAARVAIELDKARIAIGPAGVEAGTEDGIGYVSQYAYKSQGDGSAKFLFDLGTISVPGSVILLKPRDKTAHYRLVIDLVKADQKQFDASLGQGIGPLRQRFSGEQPDGAVAVQGVPEIGKAERAEAILAQERTEEEALNGGDPNGDDTIAAQQIIRELTERSQEIEHARATQQTLARIPTPRVKPTPHLSARKSLPTIVIDPGHGGRHPGAVGPTGLIEKTVTLSAAKILKEKLLKMGYRVILTREDDSYLELEDRINRAKKAQADLFLSIHADAHDNAALRGGSVYTLSENGSKRLARQFRSDGNFALFDKNITAEDNDVGEILFDLAHTDTKNQSARFSAILINQLSKKVTMVNNTHRQAGYVVLLSPDIPAVLLELAFISNKLDEKNLKSVRWRNKVMTAVAQSIDAYFKLDANKHALRGQIIQKPPQNTLKNMGQQTIQ